MPTAAIHPLNPVAVPPRPAFAPRSREYSVADMAALLCIGDLTARTIIDRLRALADQEGMPLPRNPRSWGGRIQRGSRAICAASRWCALTVDAWLDGRDPPPGYAAPVPDAVAPRRSSATIHHIMQGRARALRAAG